MTSRCQGLFPPHPFFKGKTLGKRLLLLLSLSLVSRFALMSRSAWNIAFAPLGSQSACHAGYMHYRNHEKDSGNSIMKIWPWRVGGKGGGAMTPVGQASAHQSCGAKHQDGRPMLFGFLVIFTHQYRLTELCILNAENVEKVHSRPFKQMSWQKQRRFSIVLTINIMQPRGISWRVLRCFRTSVANVLWLLRPLI